MARQNATNFTGSLQFPYATTSTDPFLKEDIQVLAQAVDQHDHTTGKGLGVSTAIADGSITSAKIADGTIQSGDMAAGSAAANIGTLGGVLTGTLPNPGLATGSVTSTVIADGTIAAGDLASGAAASNVGALGGALSGTLPNPSLAALPANSVGASQITDLSVGTAELADGAVTSAKIQDGAIATADLANQSVTNVKLGTDTARANLLTNGGFEIWQRGNGPFTSAYHADQWNMSPVGTDALSISRNTANVDIGSNACAAITFTLGTGAGASGVWMQMNLSTEHKLAGRTLSLSVRVRASVANAVRIGINNYYSSTAHYTYGTFHTGSGSYETLTVTATLDPTATFAQPWIFFAATGTFYLDNAMLVVGSVAADYAPLHPADDLARCLRYYELLGETAGSLMISQNNAAATGTVRLSIPYKARKTVAPTITKVGTWTVTNCGQPTLNTPGVDMLWAQVIATAAGDTFAYASGAGNCITVEANP